MEKGVTMKNDDFLALAFLTAVVVGFFYVMLNIAVITSSWEEPDLVYYDVGPVFGFIGFYAMVFAFPLFMEWRETWKR